MQLRINVPNAKEKAVDEKAIEEEEEKVLEGMEEEGGPWKQCT